LINSKIAWHNISIFLLLLLLILINLIVLGIVVHKSKSFKAKAGLVISLFVLLALLGLQMWHM